jgi:hypothetical protein
VGGFLGLGSKTEYFDDVTLEDYDETKAETVQEVVQPHWVALGTWVGETRDDRPYEYFYEDEYEVGLTPTCEFEIRHRRGEGENDRVGNFPDKRMLHWEENVVPLSSLADIMILFDYSGYASEYFASGHVLEWTHYLGPRSIFRSKYFSGNLELTRLFQKGFGLLHALEIALDKGAN